MDYIYGKLGRHDLPGHLRGLEYEYEGVETETAAVNIDNDKRTISVDMKPKLEDILPKVPETDGEYVLRAVVRGGEVEFEWIQDGNHQYAICGDDTICSDTLCVESYDGREYR